jgi:hypothetical protein
VGRMDQPEEYGHGPAQSFQKDGRIAANRYI